MAPSSSRSKSILARLTLSAILLLWTFSGWAQVRNPAPTPGPLSLAEGEQLARSLIANLLSQKPNQNASNAAVVKIRGADRKTREVPARFEILLTPTNFWNRYEAAVPGTEHSMKLTIIHSDGQPNEYLLSEPAAAGATNRPARRLTGSELSLPFAGSDFWVQDLGLEFLHWPQQRVLKKEMRKGQFCAVLESRNLHPVRGDYLRVVSWLGLNHPDELVLIHADGYDFQNKVLKEFDPKNLEKVNGVYQLESMEMRSVQTDSRTLIEFNLGNQ
jgi:hypothetical protein